MALKLYCDLLSQPARSIYLLLKYCGTNFEHISLDILRGDHLKKEYEQINKLKLLPAVYHDGFKLSETNAIIRYLANMGMIQRSLYPEKSKKQARVDEFLEWQYQHFRLPLSTAARVMLLEPILSGSPSSSKRLESFIKRMETGVKLLEEEWLSKGHPYIVGDHITVADFLAVCEIETHRRIGYDFSKTKNIDAWNLRVKEALNPYFDEAHKRVDDVIKQKN